MKLRTREENIRMAKRVRKIEMLTSRFRRLFLGFKGKSPGKELFIETEFGTVRTLGYGAVDQIYAVGE